MQYTEEWQEVAKNKEERFKALSVKVRDNFILVDEGNRLFKQEDIVMLAWNDDKRKAHYWANAKPINKEPITERRWKTSFDKETSTDETTSYYIQKDIDEGVDDDDN